MFVGHFGLGFAAKRAAPEVSLGTLILACQLADILWPTFVLLGLETFEIRPGMPLTPFSNTRYGLGLWNSLPATLAVELPLFAAGVALYATATVARDRIGAWAWWSLVAFLAIVYVMNLMGPPPPDVHAVAWVTESGWLLVLWAWWIDRHRAPRTLASS